MKMTKESLLKIICAADEVISALAGTNDGAHKDDTDKMVRLWDDLNDRYAPPEVVRELASMALAAMDCNPVAWIVHARTGDQLTTDGSYVANAEGILGLHSTPLYRHAQPAPVVPDEWAIADAVKFCKETGRQDAGAAMDAWNACRAAMLNGGKP